MLNSNLHPFKSCDLGSAGRGEDQRQDEQGFILLGLIVAIFLILLALGIAAPKVAHEMRRTQEVETIRRGNQYVRAIQVYYRKVGHYPGSMEELEKTNNIRFLRHQYVDPMTGKVDWRLVPVGEAKTTVKGFFGQPLAGISNTGLGSAAGMASPGGVGSPVGYSNGSSGSVGSSSTSLGSPLGGSNGTSGTGSGFGSSSNSSSGGIGGQANTGPFLGVGLAKPGNSITVLNEQTTYATWEFIYDPRIEQLKAKSSLFGGGMTSTSSSSLGSASGMSSSTSTPGSVSGQSPQTGTGAGGSMGGSMGGSGLPTSPQ